MTPPDRDSDGSRESDGEDGATAGPEAEGRAAPPGRAGPSGSPTRAERFRERQGSMTEVLIALLIVFALLLIAVNLFL